MNIFDWQIPLWETLMSDLDKLAHAMLFVGPEGVGKFAFADALAARLLCESPPKEASGMACGHCSACVWLASGNHPDFRLIQPEEAGDEEEGGSSRTAARPSGQIRVDQIRALEDFVFVGSHRQGCRAALVAPAEAMNVAAANALLKILEEPPPDVYFILISSHWRRLLPTIVSRCRRLAFGRPDAAIAEQWLSARGVASARELLELAGGAPLLAADWAEQGRLDSYHQAVDVLAEKPSDPIAMAAKWSTLLKGEREFGLPQLMEVVQKWLFDLTSLKLAGRCRYHLGWHKVLEEVAAGASSAGLFSCYNDLLRIRAVASHPLNTQLFLEDMAARYLRALATGRT